MASKALLTLICVASKALLALQVSVYSIGSQISFTGTEIQKFDPASHIRIE